MKKIVPFSKEIPFRTMIAEVTDIEVTHDLEVDNDGKIDGSFYVRGKYKMTDASQIEESFDYDLPFTIEVDDKYDLGDCEIKINDFYFEIINEDTLKVNVELEISNVKEKEIDVPVIYYEEDEKIEIDTLDNFDDIIEPVNIENDFMEISTSNDTNITDIFSNIKEKEEEYASYYVYVVRNDDTIEKIMAKYNVTREDIEKYNDLKEFKNGMKLIIPSSND